MVLFIPLESATVRALCMAVPEVRREVESMSDPTGNALRSAQEPDDEMRKCMAQDGRFVCELPYNHDYHFGQTETTGHQWRTVDAREARLLALAEKWRKSANWHKQGTQDYAGVEYLEGIEQGKFSTFDTCARELLAALRGDA